jgi:hypothetical protein
MISDTYEKETIDEQFKAYGDIFKPDFFSDLLVKCNPDGRREKFTIEDWYDEVSVIKLNSTVPKVIQEQYGVAKNVLLYSWYSYRMRMVAWSYSLSVLENALRERFNKTSGHKSSGLRKLLQRALRQGILNDGGFQMTKYKEVVTSERREGDTIYTETERIGISESEREESKKYIEDLCEAIPNLRNSLAHGNHMLISDTITPMYVTAEIINMLFEEKK